MFESAVFYAFAAVLLVSATLVITSRNPETRVLVLVLAFFTAAGTWLLLRAESLAIALVVVYVGAVMVLFLFVVMMLYINIERLGEGFGLNLPLAVVVGGILVFEMIAVLANRIYGARARELPPGYSNTRELGRTLYTDYAYAFEIAAVILLVAIIAAIALTLRRPKDRRYHDPAQQRAVRREERMRLRSMPAEKE